MVKKVKIYVRSVQKIKLPLPDDELSELEEELLSPEPLLTEVESEGELEYKDGKVTITYIESAATGLENCTTTVSFSDKDPNSVSLYRAGPVKTALMFSEGQRYISVYDTGYGCFEVGIYTERCENGIDTDGGELSISYVVEIRGSVAEHTELELKVKEIL
ncbi:MAG: DUF1934 domain-containing protein [Clostridia bacterium]|nr:DUF1934 domain-containing protein [Clostridia bacterium]